ncbi:MAG: DUF308 domain-containing protein [Muribaculaceae bacterium]|nr:DUF308 domain-containing protein [Muribaculaceae bacterium]
MSNKGNALISVIIIALGAIFIWLYDHDTLPRSIVLLCGLAFAVPAVISLISVFISRKNSTRGSAVRAIQMICGVGGLIFGLLIIFMPEVFRPLLVYPFAALLIFGGAFQIFQLAHKYRPVDYPAWMFITPVLILVAGVIMLCLPLLRDPANQPWVVLITGIAAVLYGINGLLVSVLPLRLPPLHPEKKETATTPATETGSAATTSDATDATPSSAPADSSEPQSIH